MSKPVLAIVGTGWGAYPLTQQVSLDLYDIKVISPVRTLQYTPLLASAACGHFDFRLAEEPIKRQHRPRLQYFKATAEEVDFDKRVITCKPFVDDLARTPEPFKVEYDLLVLAPGCEVQTFDTPGVNEHALFLRNTNEARILQQRILQMLDAASLPGLTEQQQKDVLHIRVVGGGAIGVEAVAELYDLWYEALRHLYNHLDGKVEMSIHDVAPRVLGSFHQELSDYAMRSLKAKNIEVKTESHIEKVDEHAIYTKEDGRLPYGLLLWATGTKAINLVENLDVKKPEEGMPRILTDGYLHVLRPDGTAMKDVFALGDAADIEGNSLPTLAEVALQKGEYLVKELNKASRNQRTPFEYTQGASLAYLGGGKGVRGGTEATDFKGEAGESALQSAQ